MTGTIASGSGLKGARQVVETNAPRVRVTGRILLAEDGQFARLLASTILRQWGLEVETVGTGVAAVMRALAAVEAGSPFELILMDIQMPEMDGSDATAKLRSLGYEGPIVAITANSEYGERARCMKAGFDDYLTKPITRQALLTLVERYLQVSPRIALASDGISVNCEASYPNQALEPLYSSYANEAEMEALVTRFVDGLASQIENLRRAEIDNDFPLLERLAHQLNGAAGGYGFMPVSQAAATLEKAARGATRSDEIEDAMRCLITVCARVRKSEA